ncbi:membrane protein insertase YidC [bacterium]|nr:membrane protein insertase YidC [bacterium]
MDRNSILGFILIGVILLTMPYYLKLLAPPEEPGVADTTRVQAPIDPTKQFDAAVGNPSQDQFSTGFKEQAQAVKSDSNQAKVKTVIIETPLYSAEFSTLGASVQSWIIKPTKPYLQSSEQMIRARYANRNLVLLARGGTGLLRTEEKVFEPSALQVALKKGDRPKKLTFTLPLENGGYYKETYTIYPDLYKMDIEIESRGLGDLTGAVSALFTWGGALEATEKDSSQDLFYTEASYQMNRSMEKFKPKGKKYEEEVPIGPTDWVAQRVKYFVMALDPETPADGARLSSWPDTLYQGQHTPKLIETGLLFSLKNGELDHKITLYLGPLDKQLISAVDPSLQQTMSWGWPIIKPFSIAVLWTLEFLHRFIPNYGLVLIIFSILIKIIVWPLTHKSHESMKRMQLLQPKIKEIQEKHKNNPQHAQKEIMAMYKEHKVNPMGGCWPVALQMPLLYSLFIIFRSTIELRGASFVLWIKDLSMPDVLFELPFSIPLYGDHVALLPFIMSASTYMQSKQTMTEPSQKPMLYMMPIMFIFLFNNFPSGLTLYYTLFNLLSWAQQHYMKVKAPDIDKELNEVKMSKARAESKKGKKQLKK